ncbi:MAG: hypothetical protein IKW89_14110 [Bacteroidales bacterium]|nr:hypothetical protein [Bacteroidales bacterium]
MRKFLLKLLMGASLTTSVFIFQACYGTPVPPADVPRSQTELQEAIPDDPEAPSDEEENLEEKNAETLD